MKIFLTPKLYHKTGRLIITISRATSRRMLASGGGLAYGGLVVALPCLFQMLLEIDACVAFRILYNLFGRACGDKPAATVSAFGT